MPSFLSPFGAWIVLASFPTAGAVGCILAPLRGWGVVVQTAVALSREAA